MFSHENAGQLVESPLGGHLEAREQKQHDLVQCHSSPLFPRRVVPVLLIEMRL